ncbi:DUF6082 family protein [Actinoallomurus liliacearum]|uniref:DUF6082 family protein n=1 Tax=Actinoallomurus liliacearum TaxID=1080073 RepID=UPI0031E603D1
MQLANIGQAYEGAISLLTIFTLLGVVISVVLQVKEVKANRMQNLRSMHLGLMQIALSDPIYGRTWTASGAATSKERLQEVQFINIVFWFLMLQWELGEMTESRLRETFSKEMFPNAASREYWEHAGEIVTKGAETRKQMRFYAIVEQEYRKAVTQGKASVPSATQIAEARRRKIRRNTTVGLVAFGAPIVSLVLAFKRKTR